MAADVRPRYVAPHGYEGQGRNIPRLGWSAILSAEDNWQVCNVTQPANYCALPGVRRNFRKPLIQMSPKSLLRHKACVSALEDSDGNDLSSGAVGQSTVDRKPGRGRRYPPGGSVLRQGLFRPGAERDARGLKMFTSCASSNLSLPVPCGDDGTVALPECGGGLVSGRAGKQRRLVLRQPPDRTRAGGDKPHAEPAPALCRAAGATSPPRAAPSATPPSRRGWWVRR